MLIIMSIATQTLSGNKYLTKYIEALKNVSPDIIFCVSPTVDEDLLIVLRNFSSNILKFDSQFDSNRWKKVLCEHLSRDGCDAYDRILFCNDSLYGPLFDLNVIINDYNIINADFWGLTVHGSFYKNYQNDIDGEWPRFIQTCFWGVNSRMLHSDEFWWFFKNLNDFSTYEDEMKGFEYILTEYFSSKGFRWEVYADTSDKETADKRYFESFILFDIYHLVSEKKYPFIPKYVFEIDSPTILVYNMQQDVRRVLDYVDRCTGYDIDLIYDNILPRLNLKDIVERTNEYHVLPKEGLHAKRIIPNGKVALFCYLYYEDLFRYSVSKIKNLPLYVDLYIATDTLEKKSMIMEELDKQGIQNQINIFIHNGKGRDISSLLVTFKDVVTKYKNIGFIHDKKSGQMAYSTVGECFNDNLWENMLYSQEYVEQIIDMLEKKEKLGMLAPPMIPINTYFHTEINSWTICFKKTKKLLCRLGVSVPLSRDKNPVFLGSVFWAKTDALKNLFEHSFDYDDFPNEPLPVDGTISHAIERCFPYVAQSNGYYVGYILTNEYAGAYINLYKQTTNLVLQQLRKNKRLDTSTLQSLVCSLKKINKNQKSFWKLMFNRKM